MNAFFFWIGNTLAKIELWKLRRDNRKRIADNCSRMTRPEIEEVFRRHKWAETRTREETIFTCVPGCDDYYTLKGEKYLKVILTDNSMEIITKRRE